MKGALCVALVGVVVACLAAAPAMGQARRNLTAVPATVAPRIDGRMDEASWRNAEPAVDFVQREPNPGSPATLRTSVRIMHDEEALYVGARMDDPAPDSIIGRLARRDDEEAADEIAVILDARGDRRTAYAFSITARGVKRDSYLYDFGTAEEPGWDAVWDAAVRVDSAGWTAEFRIPLSQLHFGGRRDGGIAMQLVRRIPRRREIADWSPTPASAPGALPYMGELAGLAGGPGQLELNPYLLSGVTTTPAELTNPLLRPLQWRKSIGADFRASLTQGLTLSGAFNPDFGQVEADPSVVNLTAFETFYEERRPLFVEGSDIFGVPIGDFFDLDRVFYSRRIGELAAARADGPDIVAIEPISGARILGAAKVSGRAGDTWDVGLLSATTEEVRPWVIDTLGRRERRMVAPLSAFGVARVSKSLRDGNSGIGGMLTWVGRREGDEAELPYGAMLAAVDARHRTAMYEGAVSVSASRLTGDADAMDIVQRSPTHLLQRPDRDPKGLVLDSTRTSLDGLAAYARFTKYDGNWRWGASGRWLSSGYDVNQMGFQLGSDLARAYTYVGYERFEPTRVYQTWFLYFNQSEWWTSTFERQQDSTWLVAGMRFTNTMLFTAEFWRRPTGLSASELRGGPELRRSGQLGSLLRLSSDERRSLRLSAELKRIEHLEGTGEEREASLEIASRALGRLDVGATVSAAAVRDQLQYVTDSLDGRASDYVFGRLAQRTVSVTTRGALAFKPNLTLQIYAQPFASRGRFDRFSEVTDPRAASIVERFRAMSTSDAMSLANPDFNERQVHASAVMRWEYRRGSTLFVVVDRSATRDLDPAARFGLNELVRSASLPATTTVAVKASYWLGR